MAKQKPQSREERLKKKRECERTRREKIKQDNEKLKALQDLKHELYLKSKETKKVKLINDMNEREKRQIRKRWRDNTRKRRQRLKMLAETARFCENSTPPESDVEIQKDILVVPVVARQESSQKKRGRKQIKRAKAAAYRQVNKLKVANRILGKKCERYKKRYQRLLAERMNNNQLSPKSKVDKMLKGVPVSRQVRKRLLFAEAIHEELKSTFEKLTRSKEKQVFTKILQGRVIKKYRVLGETKDFLPKKLFLSNARRLNIFSYERQTSNTKHQVRNIILQFWEEDEYSTLCPDPAPNRYILPSTLGNIRHDPTTKKEPSFTIRNKLKDVELRGLGPGLYNVRGKTRFGPARSEAFTIGAKVPELGKYCSPGPGYYKPKKPPKVNPPKYTIGKRIRVCELKGIPAPNNYVIPSTLGPRVPDKICNGAFTIGSKLQTPCDGGIPAPNWYGPVQTSVYKPGRSAKYTMREKTGSLQDKSPKVAPNTYYPKLKNKLKAPAYTFGIRELGNRVVYLMLEDIRQ